MVSFDGVSEVLCSRVSGRTTMPTIGESLKPLQMSSAGAHIQSMVPAPSFARRGSCRLLEFDIRVQDEHAGIYHSHCSRYVHSSLIPQH